MPACLNIASMHVVGPADDPELGDRLLGRHDQLHPGRVVDTSRAPDSGWRGSALAVQALVAVLCHRT
jgi:hypothetical protein